MRRVANLVLFLLVASCTPEPDVIIVEVPVPADPTEPVELPDSTSTTDSGRPPTNTDEVYTGPTFLELLSVTCNGNDDVTFYAETAGWTSDGIVNAAETGNAGPLWNEEHDLLSVDYDDLGWWDVLEQQVWTGADLQQYVPNSSSVFRCDWHYDLDEVMTYVFRVYDLDGNLADCAAYGHDPAGLVNGDYDSDLVNGISQKSELGGCSIW